MIGEKSGRAAAAVVVLALALGALAMAIPCAEAETSEVYSYVGDLPEERVFAAAVEYKGSLYVFGGFVSDLYGGVESGLNTTLIYDIETGETVRGADIPQGGALISAALGNDGLMYVFGGYNSSFGYTPDVQIYDPEADTWSTGADAPIDLGGSQVICAPDGLFYMFGAGVWWDLNSTLIYDPVADAWKYAEDQPGNHGVRAAVLLNETAVLVCGGYDMDTMSSTNATHIYDIEADSWTTVSSMPTAAMFGRAELSREGYAYFIGGSTGNWADTGTTLNTMQIYDPDADEWRESDKTIPSRNSYASVTDEYGRFFLIGGYTGFTTETSVVMVFPADVETDRIEITSPSEGEVVRGEVAVTATHSSPLVWIAAMDFYVDGDLTESQFGAAFKTEWTFMWDTTGLIDGSSHVLMVRAFLADGTIREHSITVTYSAHSLDERLDMLELELASLGLALDEQSIDIADLQDSTDVALLMIEALQADIDVIAGELDSLAADIDTMDQATADRIAALEAQIEALETITNSIESMLDDTQTSVDDLMDSVDDVQGSLNETQDSVDDVSASVDNKMDGALGLAIIGLLVVVILLMVVMMLMGRKPKTPTPLPEPPPE